MKRPRKTKPKAKDALQLMLDQMPANITRSRRDEYELLAYYLAETSEKTAKAASKVLGLNAQLVVWRAREAKLRAQLLNFEPELDGMAPGTVIHQPPPTPPEQPGAVQ